VKGVPPTAAEVIEIVWAGERNVNEPGEPAVKVQLRAIEVGDTVSPDVVAVTVSLTLTGMSGVPPALKVIVVGPVVFPTHPTAALTV
jgi:hypothetical protein